MHDLHTTLIGMKCIMAILAVCMHVIIIKIKTSRLRDVLALLHDMYNNFIAQESMARLILSRRPGGC